MDFEEDAENLFEETEDNSEANQNGKSSESPAGARVAPPKRIIKNPRLKFNPERLCGERGIPVLVDHFKNVKFKGKGYEVEDLDRLMAALEHWAHRLFPSMKFEDCLHQMERLGKKRPVQTCLAKIRMDMPILSSDFVHENEEDNVLRDEDLHPVPKDPFDQLISDGQDASESPFVIEQNSLGKAASSSSSGQVLGSQPPSKISEDLRLIMERNRLLAIERRKAKLASLNADKPDSQPASDQTTTASFDSLLTSVADGAYNKNLPEKRAAECQTNMVPGKKKSHVMSVDDLSCESNENRVADMDSTLQIVTKSISTLDADDTEMLEETLPLKQPFDDLVSCIDLVEDSNADASGIILEKTVPFEGAVKHLGETSVASEQRETDQVSSNSSPEEYLGLESLMDLVDDD